MPTRRLIMKIWKKINKGFLLAIIVLAVLIIYLIGVEKQRKTDKVYIKEAAENFVSLTDKLVIVPEEMQNYTGVLTKENEEKIKNNLKVELGKVMIDNEEAVKLQCQYLLSELEEGFRENQIRTNCKRTIYKISSYEFDGDQVTIRLATMLETTYKSINPETNKEEEKKNNSQNSDDEIVLQKVNNEWKVVYSSLGYFDGQMSYNNSMVLY